LSWRINKPARQRNRETGKQINSKSTNKEKEYAKKLHLEGKAVTEAEGKAVHHL
jgi:hypothetical protein